MTYSTFQTWWFPEPARGSTFEHKILWFKQLSTAVIPTSPSWVTTPRNRILRNRNRKLLLPSSSSAPTVLRHDPRQSIRGCLIWPIIAVARSSNNLSQGVLPTKSDLLLRALNYVSTQRSSSNNNNKTDHKHFCTNFSQCPTPRVSGTDPINHISGPFSDSSTPEWQSRRLLVEVA